MTAPTSPSVVPANDVRELVERLRRNAATFNRNGFAVSEAKAITEAADMLERLTEDERDEDGDADDTAFAARFARLRAIVGRIIWLELGVPSMDNPETKWALFDLAKYVLNDELEQAWSRALADRSEPRQEKEGKA